MLDSAGLPDADSLAGARSRAPGVTSTVRSPMACTAGLPVGTVPVDDHCSQLRRVCAEMAGVVQPVVGRDESRRAGDLLAVGEDLSARLRAIRRRSRSAAELTWKSPLLKISSCPAR